MQRMPNVGSMVSETGVAGVNLVKPLVNTVMFLPGLIEIWGKNRACGLNSRGHALLAKCGADVLNWNDFFDSLQRASTHYWRGFSIVAQHVRDLRTSGSEEVARVIDGVAYYGDATLLPTTNYRTIVKSVKIPINDMGGRAMQAVLRQTPGISLLRVPMNINPIRMAHFGHNLIVGTLVDLLKGFTQGTLSGPQSASRIATMLTSRLFDMRDAFYQTVTLGSMQGCNALSLMIGFNNPIAILLRKQCEAGILGSQGVLDLFLAMTVTVPFVKCVCVDAAAEGANFGKHATEQCLYFAPDHMKPTILDIIQQDATLLGSAENACRRMVDYSVRQIKDSMQPWFTAQYQAAEQVASSLDYLLKVFDVDAGR